MNSSPVNSCSGSFFDSGGSFSRYGNNENIIKTICPSGNIGTHIEVQFLTSDIGLGDNLCIYDGENLAAEQLLCTANDAGDLANGAFKVAASAPNTSGCLTFHFTSDGAGTGQGWESLISCGPAHQRIIAELESSTPAAVPLDNGYIDVCPGDNVTFIAKGNYPQNGYNYFQSDATSTFKWDFGDGTIGFGPNIVHTYQRSGGYIAQLIIEDIQGCTNNNVISQRVRVSTKPSFTYDATFPDQVCANDTLVFLNNINQADSYVGVIPKEGVFSIKSGNVDSIPLPDGVNVAYESPVTFNEFIPGALITNVNLIESICINIEHSYLRDLDISIQCPDGQIMRLDTTNVNFSLEAYLGVPYEADDNIPGNLDDPIPGIGYTYCFTPTPQYGTFYDVALSLGPQSTLPEGTYEPVDGFNTLLGCSVNGEWKLIVEDRIKQDNGWLFSWSITFAEELRANIETFTPSIVDWGFIDNETMIHNDQDSMVSIPGSAGTSNYIFQVTDEFGCMFDTTISYSVVAPTDPSCFLCEDVVGNAADEGICEGEDVQLEVEYLGFDESTIPFINNTPNEFGNATNPPSAPLFSTIAVAGASPNVITNITTDIASVCMDIDSDAAGDLQIYLKAPSGEVIELTTNNGGTGDNFRNTCFSPAANLPLITSGTAPFTGSYQPEGSWNVLVGAQVNGKWELSLADAFGPLEKNILNSWSISFNVENEVEYSWSPSAGLSCTTCPDPIAQPDVTTEYIVMISDDFGCVGYDTIVVNVVPNLAAPVVTVEEPAPGVVVFEWLAVPNANSYEVNVNGMGWFAPNNGTLSHFLTGLSDGDPIDFKVRGQTDIGSCVTEETNINFNLGECLMEVVATIIREISCFEQADATIAANVNYATPPVMYTLDDGLAQGISLFQNIGPGMHKIVVEDGDGCIDSVFFDLVEPPAIVIDTIATDVTCVGAADGTLFAAASGGVGGFSYLWATVPTTFDSVAINQRSGSYTVQATDANNCRVQATATINEPEPIIISLQGDEPSCNGGVDGTITSTVTGGNPPYAYEWSNLMFTEDVMVGAGEYFLTVTDASLCETIASIQITEPAPGMATATSTEASCHNTTDGTATIDLVGTGTHSFQWDDPLMQNTQVADSLAPGVYNFTLTDAQGCNTVGFVGIGAPAEVQSSVSTAQTSCFGGADGTATVTVSGGVPPYMYEWNTTPIQTLETAEDLEAGVYEVIITDQSGCTSIQTGTVDSAVEITTVIDSTFASCIENADGTASVFPIGGTGTYTYLWDDSAGQTTSLASDLLVGTYTVTITDTNLCSVTDEVQIIAGDPVRIDSIVANMPSCFGENDGSLVGFISGGEATYNYTWSDPNMQFFNPATALRAGDYTLTVTDQNGCSDVRSITLNQPDSLMLTVSLQQVACFGDDTGGATAIVEGGTYPYTYRLDGQLVSDSVMQNFTVGEYLISVTDRNGCFVEELIEITQPLEPLSFTLMQVDTSCYDAKMGSVQLSVSGGTGLNYIYDWGANISSNSDFANNLDTGMIYISVIDENLCVISDSILVQQYDEIDVSTITNKPSCYGFPDGVFGVVKVEGGAGFDILENYSYSWEGFPDDTSQFLTNLLGEMFYTVTVTDSQGCIGIDTDSLGQPSQITLDIDKQNPSCFGLEDGYIDITAVNGDNAVDTYLWSTTTNNMGQRIDDLSDGNYVVTVTDVEGCSVVTSIILNEPDILELSLVVTNNICDGDMDGQIVAEVMGGTVPYDFDWNNGESTQTINNLIDADYSVTVTDTKGCTITEDTVLIAPPAIQVVADVSNITCFEGSDGSYILNTTGGSAPYEYSSDGEFFTIQNIKSGLETGAYPVFIRDNRGCVWDSLIQIGTVPQFNLFAGEDQFIAIGDSTDLSVTLFNPVGTTEIVWSSVTDFDLTCTECETTTVSPIFTAIYEAYGIDSNGCDANDFVTVFVQKIAQIMVPTGFTPNGDNNNDLLVVHGKSKNITEISNFRIYDRWGETVYERSNFNINDESIGWDGTFRGEEMGSGVYIWTLQVSFEDGSTDNFQGSTTLIR